MSPEPQVKPLPYNHRKYFFRLLFVVFALVMPVFLFYAIGYRYDFGIGDSKIVSTGGMYISAEAEDVDMFLDEEFINDVRLFRNASYVQSIDVGSHSLHVQAEGLQTWTKDLPVYPHIVTEAQSFNMPLIPQARIITPYLTKEGQSVVFVATSSEIILPAASSTDPIFKATTTATSTYLINPEYEYVLSLFSTSSASSTLVERVVSEVEDAFKFDSSATTSLETPTTTKKWRDVILYKKGDEVYVSWDGDRDSIPYYYCIDHTSASSTNNIYGEHVYESISRILSSSSNENIVIQNDRMNVCRDEIRIDRKWKNVIKFDFFPDSIDLVLLLLEDGLYVVEADDRSWQNTQLLYPGPDFTFELDGGRIYISHEGRYFELLTELTQ